MTTAELPEIPKTPDDVWALNALDNVIWDCILNIQLVEMGVVPKYIQDMDHAEFEQYNEVVAIMRDQQPPREA